MIAEQLPTMPQFKHGRQLRKERVKPWTPPLVKVSGMRFGRRRAE